MNIPLDDLCRIWIEEGRSAGAHAEICADYEYTRCVHFGRKEVEFAASKERVSFGYRVIENERQGFVTTDSLGEDALRAAAKDAIRFARLSPPSPDFALAPKLEAARFELYDPKVGEIPPAEIARQCQYIIDELSRDPRIRLTSVDVKSMTIARYLKNTNDVSLSFRKGLCRLEIAGMAADENDVTGLLQISRTVTKEELLENSIVKACRDFREAALSGLGTGRAKSYKGRVLIHPAAVSPFLQVSVASNICGDFQEEPAAKWKPHMIGSQVASPLYSFLQYPTDESRGQDWSPFDREGVLTRKFHFIKDGVLQAVAHNCATGKKAGTPSTGNSFGRAEKLPGVWLPNMIVEPGRTSEKELLSALGTGLMIKGFAGSVDNISGTISGLATNSYWVENGEIAYPVREVMIQGNVFEVLRNILAVGDELGAGNSSLLTPSLLIDGLSVTAKPA